MTQRCKDPELFTSCVRDTFDFGVRLALNLDLGGQAYCWVPA